jgi:hypothetical protein
VDVLRKQGNVVELIEVKSKSFDQNREDHSFRGKRGEIRSTWLAYLQDVAFQTYVMRQAYSDFDVRPYLLLVDPTVACPVDGLGTAIRVERDAENRARVSVDATLDVRAIRPPVLRLHDVEEYVAEILAGVVATPAGSFEFAEFAEWISEHLLAGRRPAPTIGKQCRKCEFYCEPGERSAVRRSGWAECMQTRFSGHGDADRTDTVFALYNHRKVEELLANGKLLLSELDEGDVGDEESAQEITSSHRHRLQIREARGEDAATLLRIGSLRDAFESWRYPLHFIDFETSRPTLPYTAGRRPNQQLLFQFSHHVLDEAGRLVHRTQCLEAEPGVVPNAAVVRALRDALSGDDGTVLHWWDHERVVLDDVRKQIAVGDEPDGPALAAFVVGLIGGVDGRPARLVDMGRPLVAKTAFIAGTDGRSSIKKVLQAVMQQSEYLRERYGRPVYGTAEMPSLNFKDWTWWQEHDGVVRDPYTLLGQLLADPELDRAAREEEDEASVFVANGGAAMVAFGQLQRSDLEPTERKRLEDQLKRYCELDTLAMVMVYEALRDWVE